MKFHLQRTVIKAVLSSSYFAFFGVSVGQELAPGEIDVAALGPQVGELVPEFSLPDQHGDVWTRESIMGPRGAMLVFVRSADW